MLEINSKVIEGVAFANTPSYLYNKVAEYIRANGNLSPISNSGLKFILKQVDFGQLDSVTEAYICLLALIQRGESYEKLASEVDLAGLPWANHLAHLAKKINDSSNQVFTPHIHSPSKEGEVANTPARKAQRVVDQHFSVHL